LRAADGLTANASLTPASRPVGEADKFPSAAGASCVAYQSETPFFSYLIGVSSPRKHSV
jgi:hypothetical protein